MPRFIIMMTENDNAWARLTDRERGEIMPKYFKWVEELKAAGWFKSGAPMASGGRILTGGRNNRARVWDAASGEPVTPWLRHEAWIEYAAFSSSSRPRCWDRAERSSCWTWATR